MPPSSPTMQRPANNNPLLPNDLYQQQNIKLMQQGGMTVLGIPPATVQKLPDEIYDEDRRRIDLYMNDMASKIYQDHFNQLLLLNPDSFSITKAIYLVESAFNENKYSFEAFESAIKDYASVVRQLLNKERLNAKNNIAVNYGIQKLFRQSNTYYNNKTGKTIQLSKFTYDFNDFMGKNNWRNMFVEKLLSSGSGQCHSLPLLYLCIAEQLKGKAYLSLSPNHSFIQYFDEKGRRFNFETTNGHLVSSEWLMQSASIPTAAFKNGTYLDTLTSRKLFAQCLYDMMYGYIKKLRYDPIAEQMMNKILEIDSSNISALMTLGNILKYEFNRLAQDYNNPPPDQIKNYPVLQAHRSAIQQLYQQLDTEGVQYMPPDIYQQWLKSMDEDNQKEQDRLEYEKLLRELQKLKIKPTFKNKPIK